MSKMTKIVAILATVTALGIGTLIAPQAAQAGGLRHHGFFGGFLIGSAVGYAPYYYGYAPYYDWYSQYGYSPYYAGYYGAGSGCFWTRTHVRHGSVWRWRRVWVCE